MRVTPTIHPCQPAPRRAACGVGGRFEGSTWLALGATVALVSVLGTASSAQADSRGACVETSATSAPTAAPLALDAERAAWVAGHHARGGDAALGYVPGRAGNPAWCEAGDGPECERGEQAPTRNERAASSDAGATCATETHTETHVSVQRPAHPPIRRGHGATGMRHELERPPTQR